MDENRGHTQIDHTADLALRIWAPTEEGLLVEAGRALMEVLTGGAKIAESAVKQLKVDSVDAEDRLVAWLNELLVLATTDGFLFANADLKLREDGVDAELHGEGDGRALLRSEVKSATHHDLRLERRPGRVTAQVVIDV